MNDHRDHPTRHSLDRRGFLRSAGLAGAGVALSDSILRSQQAPPQLELSNTGPDKIPRKPFGSTQERVSVMGLGGYSLGDAPSLKEAIAIVHEAVDAGVNFFDNAWEYHGGKSEEWMGQALKGRRDKVFLMTKVCTHGRDKNVGLHQLEESLKRLQTDHLDLWQVHECVYDNDPERHFAKGGVIEALDEAKKAGKVRYVGFTGHKNPAIHLKMLSYNYPFDSVQMPLNAFDYSYRSFQKLLLPEVNKRGMAGPGHEELGGKRAADRQGRGNRRGGLALRDEPRRGDHHQRHRLLGRAEAEPGNRPRLPAHDSRGDGDPGQALCGRRRGRPPGAIQIDDEIRRRRGPGTARPPVPQGAAAVGGGITAMTSPDHVLTRRSHVELPAPRLSGRGRSLRGRHDCSHGRDPAG
jgi:aryl-alcohol dehydrogenase-like predicted oxidoreductase